jgi:hypothetical protein
VGIFVFIYLVYRLLTDQIPVGANYWSQTEFFVSSQDQRPVYNLEWTHTSPPEFHTYAELPYLAQFASK